MIFVNWYAEKLPINEVTMAKVSATIPTLFTPPGYVFSIWILIYGLLFCYVIFQFFPKQKCKEYYDKISLPFIITCLLNSLWVVLFHYFKFGYCLVVIILLMLYLGYIYKVLNQYKKCFNGNEELFVYLPFSLYFSWITIAVIANVSIVLTTIGWGGFGIDPIIWMIIILLFGLALALYIAKRFNDPYVLMVYLWAYLGITFKFVGQESRGIVITGTLSCVLMILTILWMIKKEKEPC